MKRQQFRKNIRQRHIQNIFNQIRSKKRVKVYTFPEIPEQIGNIMMGHISSTIHQIIILKKNNKYQQITEKISQCIESLQKNPIAFMSSFNKFLKEIGEKIIDAFKKDVPESVLGDYDDDDYNQFEKKQVDMSMQSNFFEEIGVIHHALKLSSMIQYENFDLQSNILITKVLWNVFSENYHLPNKNYPQTYSQSTQIMLNLCKSLARILQNPQTHHILKKHMKQMGLPQKLSSIIDIYVDLNPQEYAIILNLIYLFSRKLRQEIDYQNLEDLGGIVVIGIDSGYYEKFCAFCLYFLKKRQHEALYSSLAALEEIFNEAAYLIDSCQFSSIADIMDFINIEDRQISSKALQLFNTIIFYSQSTTDELVEKTDVLTVIHHRLKQEEKIPKYDPYTEESILRCTNIICDMLLSKDKKVKQKIYQHPIWEYLYECIQENHPLLGTIVVFNYFFEGFGRKRSLTILPSYLQAVSNLNLANQENPYTKDVKSAIRDLFARSMEYWEQEHYHHLRDMLNSYNLLSIAQGDEND